MAIVDMALFQLLTDGDREFAEELVEMWESKTNEDLLTLQGCIDSGDADTLLKVAHSLKGASANLGALTVQYAAKDLEHLGREGDLATAGNALSSLTEQILQAKAVYTKYFAGLED
jgi:HPt (histidine-containing phosphotransfer) domain-containing protein